MKTLIFVIFLSCLVSAQDGSLYQLQSAVKSNIELQEAQPEVFSVEPLFAEKKSPFLAGVLSFLLPGMGELYADGFESGKYFTIADAAIWGVFTGVSVYANNQENNYITLAASEAGVNVNGKNEDYFANVGVYLSLEDYNNDMAFNRQFDKMYNPETHNWAWESNAVREQYRSQWTSSENAYNDIRFIVGALFINRLVSVINAVRVTNNYNNQIEQSSWNIYMNYERNETLPPVVSLNFMTGF